MKLEDHELDDIVEKLEKRITFQIMVERSDKQLNLNELIEKLKTNKRDVHNYIELPDFPKMKIPDGRELRFSDKAVDEWLKTQHTKH